MCVNGVLSSAPQGICAGLIIEELKENATNTWKENLQRLKVQLLTKVYLHGYAKWG